MKFEQKLAYLEEIVERVDDSETSLEEAISLYKEGITTAKQCAEILQTFEDDVLVLQKEAEGFTLKPLTEVL